MTAADEGAGGRRSSSTPQVRAAAGATPGRGRGRADAPLTEWFDRQGWHPAPFQREAWRRYLRGESGLLVTPTGSGKTLAAVGGPLLEALRLGDAPAPKRAGPSAPPRLRLLWITPLRALAADTTRALREPI